MVRNRSYTRHQVDAMEEDMTTEFKGHRSMLMEDENPKHWNPNNVRSHGRTLKFSKKNPSRARVG